jgi:hypothetical protein
MNALIDENGQCHIDSFYQPYPKQDFLHTSAASNLLAIGGNGSGKSAFLLGEAIYVMDQFPGSNVLLLRKDYKQLEKGLILDLKNGVPKELYKYNESKHTARWHNGSMLFFGHLKNGTERDLAQYLSAAFVFIGIDELGQFSYKAWDFLRSRNRINPGCSADIFGNMPVPRMAGATNPLGPGYGWIKRIWVDRKPMIQLGETVKGKDGRYWQAIHGKPEMVYDPHDHVFQHSTVLDNPEMLRRDPDYINKLMKLAPALRQKALDGDLNTVAGAYFGNFDYDRHILSLPKDRARIKWQHWQPVWLGIDWGLAHHATVFWFTRAQVRDLTPVKEGGWRNKVVCFRELVVNETSSKDLCHMIAALTSKERPSIEDDATRGAGGQILELTEYERLKFIFLSPERFSRTDDPSTQHTIGAEMGQILHSLALPRPVPANNRRVDGAVFMYNLLDSNSLVFLDSCPQAIGAMQVVVRDEKNLEDVLKSDSIEDDVYDGIRYATLSMLSEKGKPEDVKLQEALSKIPDHTARMMYAYEHQLKQKPKHQPVRTQIVPAWMKGRT